MPSKNDDPVANLERRYHDPVTNSVEKVVIDSASHQRLFLEKIFSWKCIAINKVLSQQAIEVRKSQGQVFKLETCQGWDPSCSSSLLTTCWRKTYASFLLMNQVLPKC